MKLIINHWNFLGVPYTFLEKPHPKTEKKMVSGCHESPLKLRGYCTTLLTCTLTMYPSWPVS